MGISVCRATSPGMRSEIGYVSGRAGEGQRDNSQPNLLLHLRARASCPFPASPLTWHHLNLHACLCATVPQVQLGQEPPSPGCGCSALHEREEDGWMDGKPEAVAIGAKAIHLRGATEGSMMGYHTAGTHRASPPCQPPWAVYRLGVSCPPSVVGGSLQPLRREITPSS